MVLSLSIPALAVADEYTDLIPRNIANEIFANYPNEILFVEEKYNVTIDKLDKSTNELIKREATDNYTNDDFDFSGLMTALSLEKARFSSDASNRQVHVNEKWSTHAEFGPVVAKVFKEVPTGVTTTHTGGFDISIRAGDIVSGVEISVGISTSSSYTVQGPADGTKLANGLNATHRLAIGALLGTVIKYEYDMYDPWTGAGGHFVEHYIEDESAKAYTLLAIIATPTYVDKGSGSSTIRCSNYQKFEDMLWKNPNQFIV